MTEASGFSRAGRYGATPSPETVQRGALPEDAEDPEERAQRVVSAVRHYITDGPPVPSKDDMNFLRNNTQLIGRAIGGFEFPLPDDIADRLGAVTGRLRNMSRK